MDENEMKTFNQKKQYHNHFKIKLYRGVIYLDIILLQKLAVGGAKDTTFLQYGPKQGSPRFRESLAKFLSKGYNDDVSR